MENGITEQIMQYVNDKFPLARKRNLKASDSLLESGVVDSMGVLDLVSFMEGAFSITVSDDELVPENFQSVNSIAEFVGRKRSHARAN